MIRRGAAVHVVTTRRLYKGKLYQTHLLRRSYREGASVRNETLANLSHLPERLIDLIRRGLRGEQFCAVQERFEVIASRLHGHVDAVLTTMRRLGLDTLIASRHWRERDLVLAMVAARILAPTSKLATTRWWSTTTLPALLGIEEATEDDCYEAMDWLLARQGVIEKKLAARHLQEDGLVLYDLTSSYFEGRSCPLAARGHDRDGKRGKLQVNYGLLTNAAGLPVAVSVFKGNTADPTTLLGQVHIDPISAKLNVDMNGVADVGTDIVYIARHLLGLPPVPASFRQGDPNIPSDAVIAANIDALCPVVRGSPTPTNSPTPINTPTPTAGQRLIDNGDGTITDTQTGLMWEKKDQAGGLDDMYNYYPWAGDCSDGSGYCQPEAAAASTCSAATGGAVGCAQCGGTAMCDTGGYTTIWQWLNQINGAGFGGYSDWRIPTSAGCCGYPTGQAAELESFLAAQYPNCTTLPCVSTVFNNNCTPGCTVANCSCTVSGGYWSSSTVASNPDLAWDVGFDGGYVDYGFKANDGYVRAVRGGS